MDVFSFTTGDFVSGLRPSIQPLGGLQDAHEAGFLGAAKRYYNYVFTELSGKLQGALFTIQNTLQLFILTHD